MTKKRGWLLLVLPLAIAACGGDEAEEAETPADSAIAAINPPPADPAAMGGMPTTLAMQPVGTSGATGQATVTPNGQQTQVQLQLSGLTPGAHPGHIHQGTCDAPGEVVQPLPEVTAGEDGTATVDTTLTLDAMTVMDGQHIIAYHGEGGAPVVCAQLVAHAM
jgi:hypothetical protein